MAAGKVKSKPVQTASGYADVVEWTLATAASNHLTVLRSFGHGVDSSFPLQEKPGNLCAYRTLPVRIWLDHRWMGAEESCVHRRQVQ